MTLHDAHLADGPIVVQDAPKKHTPVDIVPGNQAITVTVDDVTRHCPLTCSSTNNQP